MVLPERRPKEDSSDLTKTQKMEYHKYYRSSVVPKPIGHHLAKESLQHEDTFEVISETGKIDTILAFCMMPPDVTIDVEENSRIFENQSRS